MSNAKDVAYHCVSEAIVALQEARTALHLAYPNGVVHERLNQPIVDLIDVGVLISENIGQER